MVVPDGSSGKLGRWAASSIGGSEKSPDGRSLCGVVFLYQISHVRVWRRYVVTPLR